MAPPRWRSQEWPSNGLEDLTAPGNPQDMPVAPRGLRNGRVRPLQDLGDQLPTAPVLDASDYPSFNGSQPWALITTTDTIVSPKPNALRNALIMRNASATAANIYVEFGGPASANSIIKIVPGNHVLFDRRVPQDDIHAYSDAAGGVLIVATSQTPGQPAF